MSGVFDAIGKLFGGGDDTSKLLAQQQNALIASQAHQQLAVSSQAQAVSDNEAAALKSPNRGRAMLAYQDDQRAGTLGG